MITNPQVFEEDHLPRSLEHREAEVRQVTRAFEPAVDGNRAEDLLISGPSGVGKTALARFALDRLHEMASVESTVVRTLGQASGSILRAVIDDVCPDADVHRGTPIDDLVTTLANGTTRPTVIVLDEADDLPKTDLLERLSGIPLVSTVCICHQPEEWLASVDAPYRDAFGSHHVALERYRVDELADILDLRAQQGLRDSAYSHGDLLYIADEVAGVARRGIQSLRAAAEIAIESGHDSLTRSDIRDGFERAQDEIWEANLRSLPYHHHVLYEIVRRNGPVSGRGLHARYDDVADDVYRDRPDQPVQRSWRRDILRKLEEYDLIESEKTGGSSRYWPIDSSLQTETVISLPHSEEASSRREL